jgi:type IV pilus assembly protein PilM
VNTPLLIAPKRISLFGLDIGTESVKAVQLRRERGKVSLSGYALGELPPEMIKDGVIAEPEKLAGVVKQLLDEAKIAPIDAPYVAASLPASKTFTRVIALPKLKKKELEEAVRFELERAVPMPASELYFDWAAIGSYREGKEERRDVLVAAVPKAIADSYLAFFQKLGRLPYALETELEAISRQAVASRRDTTPVLVADIGAETTDLSIVAGGSLRLTGSVAVGGEHFTAAIATAFTVDPAKAEETKVRYGLGETGPAEKVKVALDPLLEQIITEIRRMVRFYQDRTAGSAPISVVTLSGGSSALAGLREHLEESLGIPVTISDPWATLASEPGAGMSRISAPIFTTAVGLAMGGFDANR